MNTTITYIYMSFSDQKREIIFENLLNQKICKVISSDFRVEVTEELYDIA